MKVEMGPKRGDCLLVQREVADHVRNRKVFPNREADHVQKVDRGLARDLETNRGPEVDLEVDPELNHSLGADPIPERNPGLDLALIVNHVQKVDPEVKPEADRGQNPKISLKADHAQYLEADLNQEVDLIQNREVNRIQNREVNRTQNREVNRTQNREVDRTQNQEVDRTQNQEVNRTQNQEVNRTQNQEVDRIQSQEVNHIRSHEVDLIRSHEVDLIRSHEVDLIRTANQRVNHQAGVDQGLKVNRDLKVVPDLKVAQDLKVNQDLEVDHIPQGADRSPKANLGQNHAVDPVHVAGPDPKVTREVDQDLRIHEDLVPLKAIVTVIRFNVVLVLMHAHFVVTFSERKYLYFTVR